MAYGMGYGYPFLAGKGGGAAVSPFIDAAAAYSLRDLGLGATNVVRVRRSSDNTEQDFTAAQITGGGLLAFCGSGDGFVSTWYDQSGNARNATQGTAVDQPKIVESGALLQMGSINGVGFNGGIEKYYLSLENFHTAEQSNIDIYSVSGINATSGYNYILGANVNTGVSVLNNFNLLSARLLVRRINSVADFQSTDNIALNTMHIRTSLVTKTDLSIKINNLPTQTLTTSNLANNISMPANYYIGNGALPSTRNTVISELILFTRQTDVDVLLDDINGFYNIY